MTDIARLTPNGATHVIAGDMTACGRTWSALFEDASGVVTCKRCRGGCVMSADNYFVVRKHPMGGFVALMGFASDESMPAVGDSRRSHRVFDTPEEALRSVTDEYAEYGHSIHPECDDPDP